MKMSTYQLMRKLNDYKKTRNLYRQGFPIRDIAKIVGKSRQWVWFVLRGRGIKEVERLKLPDLTLKAKV